MKKFVFAIAVLCCSAMGFAQNPKATKVDLESGKVMYFEIDMTARTAQVTWNNKINYEYAPTPEYTGDIKIPGAVTYNDEEYTVTGIGDYAFNVCDQLTSVTIPASVEHIGELAFSDTKALGIVEFESGSQLERIGNYAFFKTALPSIELPASLKVIGSNAFNSEQLTQVTFPDNSELDSIQESAFFGSAITSFTVPASVRYIGGMAFHSTTKLKEFTFADIEHSRLECIGELAFNISGVTSIVFPSSLKTIERCAFYACDVATIQFNGDSQLETIEDEAFGYTNVSAVIIPATVKTVGKGAFAKCSKLNSVINYSENVEGFNASAFDNCSEDLTMFVPFKPYEQYKALYPEIRMLCDLEVFRAGALASLDDEIKTPNTISRDDMELIQIHIGTIKNARNFYTAYNAYNNAMAIIAKQKEIEATLAYVLGSMGTKQEGTAVRLTGKDGKSFIFYAPASIEYIKVKQ